MLHEQQADRGIQEEGISSLTNSAERNTAVAASHVLTHLVTLEPPDDRAATSWPGVNDCPRPANVTTMNMSALLGIPDLSRKLDACTAPTREILVQAKSEQLLLFGVDHDGGDRGLPQRPGSLQRPLRAEEVIGRFAVPSRPARNRKQFLESQRRDVGKPLSNRLARKRTNFARVRAPGRERQGLD